MFSERPSNPPDAKIMTQKLYKNRNPMKRKEDRGVVRTLDGDVYAAYFIKIVKSL